MKVNGESIHGTTATLFPKCSWDGRSTTRRNADGGPTIYLHIFKRPEGGKLTVSGLVDRPIKARILGKRGSLKISGAAGAWTIQLPGKPANSIAEVVALTLKGHPRMETPEQ